MTATQRIVARVVALASAYVAVSLMEKVAAAAEAEAATARLAAHTADEALFAHLTGDACAPAPACPTTDPDGRPCLMCAGPADWPGGGEGSC